MSPQAHDFRSDAANESERIVGNSRLVNLLDSPSSLCFRIDGATSGPLYRIAIVPWVFGLTALGLLLAGLVVLVLVLTPWLDASWLTIGGGVAAFVLGLVLLVMSASVPNGVFEGAMERSLGGRLADLNKRVDKRYPFCVEDPATYQKQKVISEDYATGGIDRRKPGLLLEGIRYRYVIRPEDVTEVRADEDYRIVTFRVGNVPLTLALNVSIGDDAQETEACQRIEETLGRIAT